jgi:hypothetical protein
MTAGAFFVGGSSVRRLPHTHPHHDERPVSPRSRSAPWGVLIPPRTVRSPGPSWRAWRGAGKSGSVATGDFSQKSTDRIAPSRPGRDRPPAASSRPNTVRGGSVPSRPSAGCRLPGIPATRPARKSHGGRQAVGRDGRDRAGDPDGVGVIDRPGDEGPSAAVAVPSPGAVRVRSGWRRGGSGRCGAFQACPRPCGEPRWFARR